MCVLLINSNRAVSKLINLSVKKMGYDIKEIESLDEYDGSAYDVVFIDSDSYNKGIVQSMRNMKLFGHFSYIAPRGADRPENMDTMIEKPFLPTDFIKNMQEIAQSVLFVKKHIQEEQEANEYEVESLPEDDSLPEVASVPEVDSLHENLPEDENLQEFDLEEDDSFQEEPIGPVLKQDDIDEVKSLLEPMDASDEQNEQDDIKWDDENDFDEKNIIGNAKESLHVQTPTQMPLQAIKQDMNLGYVLGQNLDNVNLHVEDNSKEELLDFDSENEELDELVQEKFVQECEQNGSEQSDDEKEQIKEQIKENITKALQEKLSLSEYSDILKTMKINISITFEDK